MKRNPDDEAKRWLAQAEEEYKDAAFLMGARRYYLALYLCQQSAEKGLIFKYPFQGRLPGVDAVSHFHAGTTSTFSNRSS
jgi:hypothetical protein